MPELVPVIAVFLAFTTVAFLGLFALALGRISRDYENRDQEVRGGFCV